MDKRLLTCASLCKGNYVADIGTDHGYLPCYMVKNGMCEKALACDVAEKPLASAVKHIAEQGLNDKINTLISDGLQSVAYDGITDVVIAGMGGELISSILEKCDWIKNTDLSVNLVLQPMTKWDVLRKWLYENGFQVTREEACEEGRFVYSVMQVQYIGRKPDYKMDLKYLYCGLIDSSSDDGRKYIVRQADRLITSGNGIMRNPQRYDLGLEMTELGNKLKSEYDK